MKQRCLRWLVPLFLFPGFALQTASPQVPPAAAAASSDKSATNQLFSVSPFTQRAPWQQHLTLGPGDVLNFALYLEDALDQAHNGVVVGPDGRVSYLQAQDIMAAGLTVDELRAKIDAELRKYYRAPRTVVIPAEIHSKKYFMLGSVVSRGVFTFDRPLTVIEAIARAGGLETGIFELKTVEMADLSRSFLIRQGQKVPVDFEKLFEQGDLSQNIPLEPDDYLYFASASANEVYVLGAVGTPGILQYTPNLAAIGAISDRGGFGPKAWKSRVLVIRGSLNHPQTFVVDTLDVLHGKAIDFKLQPKDIVFVSNRPWAKAEQLLDDGAHAFIEAMLVTYTGAKVGPFISPIVH